MRMKRILVNWELYLLMLLPVAYFIIFRYLPMYGVQIAFKDFSAAKGIWDSPWVGFDHFVRFFNSYNFEQVLTNTVYLSVLLLVIAFPIPIIIALMLNQVKHQRFKKFMQTSIYAPYFISTVVLVGMVFVFLSPNSGLVNHIIKGFGGEPVMFMADSEWFRPIYVFTEVWQTTGFSSIIYLAALAAIDPHLHEAAVVDGASKWKRVLHIDLPGLMPTIAVLFILAVGNLMNIGFEKAFLMQTDINVDASEIIPTYVYKIGIQRAQYSFSAAIGLFNAVINLVLLFIVNRTVKKMSGNGLF
ncbi:putative aldouronate transport system permease protein [Paenibacillus endophyticus]|uniref:Putative aldouronate transport system permease protein n=1 Tax=Paenibacillus endophyticus TaxID=1294268 RepID=A0A7W5GC80_9BACL|nr:ABC transporter permease subunit [Paenibacillus endophyticus]MBB3154193.1 putative aldouronate transport system permease protein [Paenibacillus endophyticus]